MPAQLVSLDDGPGILLDKPILLLGRHPECDIQIESRKISRRHCCIAQVHDYLVVRDLGSTNGVRINGVRVLEGKLQTGDHLTIGTHRYQVTWEDEQEPAPKRTALARSDESPALAIPVGEFDDDLLESCDMPIALPEPDEEGHSLPASLAPINNPKPVIQIPAHEDGPIIPEELDLLPISDEFPRPIKGSSHKGNGAS